MKLAALVCWWQFGFQLWTNSWANQGKARQSGRLRIFTIDWTVQLCGGR